MKITNKDFEKAITDHARRIEVPIPETQEAAYQYLTWLMTVSRQENDVDSDYLITVYDVVVKLNDTYWAYKKAEPVFLDAATEDCGYVQSYDVVQVFPVEKTIVVYLPEGNNGDATV